MDIKNINYILSTSELNKSSIPSALIDLNGIIIWANDNFKKIYPGYNDKNFLSDLEIDINILSKDKNYQEIQLSRNNNQFIRIFNVSLYSEETMFFIEIINKTTKDGSFQIELVKRLIDKNDLKEFCLLFLSELNINLKLDKSFLIILENNQVEEIFTSYFKTNINEFKEILISNLIPLVKWFSINKALYISENNYESIGYQINQLLDANYVYFIPSYSDNKILAITIFAQNNKLLTDLETNFLQSSSNLLAIGIELINLKQKQNAIETQLRNSQKLETVGKLASGLAHDFNNLLASIFGSIKLLKNKIGDNPTALKLIDNIENCSVRARDLTKGILSFGKPTQKRKEIVFLDNVLNELLKVITETFPKYIKINFAVGNFLYKVLGNSTEIYQIFLNLCVNAKESIENEGIISLKAENIDIDDTNIFLYPFLNKGSFVKISVSDNGSGIDEENLSKIFEPYFSTKQKDTGSGLGLYVTSQLVKAMNGYIDVESKLNQGTTFRIYFPAVKLNESKTIDLKEKIIMLADDEEMLTDLLGDLLESNGFYVLKVNNTKEVFRVLNEEIKVDLLIIDYNLPEITGIDCVTKLREMGFNMPVILASGATSFSSDDITKAKINKTLQKPYEFEIILETIKNVFSN